jgi:hypothetical protein
MLLPKKRQRPKSGIERAVPRIWNRHRVFVRSHGCCVPGCDDGPIEFAHIRTAANSGTGLKPHDAFAVSLCHSHHRESHEDGLITFARRYKINLVELAREFVKRSPDFKMRASMQEAGITL